MDRTTIIIYAIVVFYACLIIGDFYGESKKLGNHEYSQELFDENGDNILSRRKRQAFSTDSFIFNTTIFENNKTVLIELEVRNPATQSQIDQYQQIALAIVGAARPNYTIFIDIEAEIITTIEPPTSAVISTTKTLTDYTTYSSEGTQTTPETDPSTTTNPTPASSTTLVIESTNGEGITTEDGVDFTTTGGEWSSGELTTSFTFEGSGGTITHTTTDAVKASETYSMGTTDSQTTDTEGSSSGDMSTAATSVVMPTMSDVMSTTNSLTTADLRTSASGVTSTATNSAMTTTMSDAMTTTMSDAMSTTASDVMATTILHDVTSTTAPDITTMVSDVMSTTAPDIMSTVMPDVMTTTAEDTSGTMSVTEITNFSEDPTSGSMTSAEQSTSLSTIVEESTALPATSDTMSSTPELLTNEVTSSGETSAESTVVTEEDVDTTSDSVTTEEVSAEATVTTETYEAKNFTLGIELANRTFTPNLLNSSSQEYQTLKVEVETALENVLTLPSIRKIEVDGFNEGSVIAVCNIEADESVTEEDIINDYQNSNSMKKSIFASSGLRSIDTPTTSTPTATNPVEVTTTQAVTTTTAKAKSQPLSDGAIAGIVLGSLFGATTIIVLIVFVVRRYHLGCGAKSEYDMRGKDYGQMPGLDELYHQSSTEEAV